MAARKSIRGLLVLLGRARTAWLTLGVTLLLVVLLEGSLRIVRSARRANQRVATASRSGFRGATWAREYMDELKLSVRTRWTPYIHWRAKPLDGQYINIDQDGVRRTVQPSDGQSDGDATQPDKLTIRLFGGSVAWGWGARDEHTVASELARELAQAGHAVEVVNYAQIGHVSTQEALAMWVELRRGELIRGDA